MTESQQIPAQAEEQKTEPLKEAFASGRREEKVIPWKGLIGGQEVESVRLVLNPKTRHMRNRAFEEGVLAFALANGGKKGFYVTVAEKTYATLRIHSWTLPGTVESLWELLEDDIGDAISDAIGLREVIKKVAEQMKGEGVERAKNS
jgi:hypothetical protein